MPTRPSRRKWSACGLVVPDAVRSTLMATTSPVSRWTARDTGRSARADQVQHLVVAVEEPEPLSFDQAFDLVVGHELAADQQLRKIVHGQAAVPRSSQISCNCRSSSSPRSNARCATCSAVGCPMLVPKPCRLPLNAAGRRLCTQLYTRLERFSPPPKPRNPPLTRHSEPCGSSPSVPALLPACGGIVALPAGGLQSNVRYFMSSRSWPKASWTSARIRRRRLVFSITRANSGSTLCAIRRAVAGRRRPDRGFRGAIRRHGLVQEGLVAHGCFSEDVG